MNPEQLDAAKQLISQAQRITIVGHVSPDGDTLGSMLGLSAALSRIDKDCMLVLPDGVPQMFSFLPGVEEVVEKPERLGPTNLIIVLDVSDPGRIGSVYADNIDLFQSTPILNIDHHMTNSFSSTCAMVDATAASSAELVLALIDDMSIPLDTVTAVCLLTGVVSDTQCFRTPNTTTRSLNAAVRLIDSGAPLPWVVDCLFKSHPIPKLSLWGIALSNIQFSGDVVWTHVTQEAFARSGASLDQSDGLIDMLAGVREARVAALFKEMPEGTIKVSLRSSGHPDVADVASYFGGGGHRGASGFSLDGSIEQAQELVLGYVSQQLRFAEPTQEVD